MLPVLKIDLPRRVASGRLPMMLWVVKPLSGEWLAAYRIVVQDGHPVIGELRIYPGTTRGWMPVC